MNPGHRLKKGLFSLPAGRGALTDGIRTALLAFSLVAALFLLQGKILINLADEGFLWYGTLRTACGELPLRDFQSYYPGRYFWGAGWFRILGDDGILALRLSTAVFGACGLTFGLLVLRRVMRSYWTLGLSGVLLLLWFYPRYKVFEPAIAMAGVYFGVILLERPSVARHFGAGVFVGVAAFFGRNHGAYGFFSFLALILLIRFRMGGMGLARRLGAWGTGIFVGFSPMILMAVLVPGFLDALVDSIMVIFRLGGTNLHLPVPWPWRPPPWAGGAISRLQAISTGLFFLALPIFYGAGLLFLVLVRGSTLRERAPLTACVLVGAVYMHYIFSRADLDHLALGIHPMLMGTLCLAFSLRAGSRQKAATVMLVLLTICSLFSIGVASPYYIKIARVRGPLEKVDIRGDKIWMSPYSANLIRSVKRISEEMAGEKQKLLIAPHWTTFYPILGRISPLRETYFLFRETEARQREMTRELDEQGVDWVILGDVALDGRDELRFRNTHCLIWRYILDNFEAVQVEGLPKNYQLLKRKG